MSKHNGSQTGREKEQHFERRRVSDPTDIQRNGISILATGPDTGKKPDEIQMIWHARSAPYAQRITFKEPVGIGALIEQMIAYRNFVFPEAAPINPDTQLETEE